MRSIILAVILASSPLAFASEELSPMQKHEQVDVVALTPDGKSVALVMVESRPWESSSENLKDLQAKIVNYLAIVESGQLISAYPQFKGMPVVFVLSSKYSPSKAALGLIELLKEERLNRARIRFQVESPK